MTDQVSDEERKTQNWTVDPETGRSNSSPDFLELSQFVSSLLRSETRGLLDGKIYDQAGSLIMAQLAHVKNVGPLPTEEIAT